MKLNIKILILSALVILLWSCGKKEAENSEIAQPKTEVKEDHDEVLTIATLTEEQMKAVGVSMLYSYQKK